MNVQRRTKWEPAALMVLVIALGLWVAFGPASKPSFSVASDARTQDVRIGNTRGLLEARAEADGSTTVLLWMKDGPPEPRRMSFEEASTLFGKPLILELRDARQNRVFRTLNITSWASMVWVGIGTLGQIAFSGRMVLQWVISERRGRSVISESFWWFSLFGGLTLFSYFVWRQDPVGILGQASGIVVYARNIRLLRKHARREARSTVAPQTAQATPLRA